MRGATILVFHMERAKEKQIRLLCRRLNIEVIKVTARDYQQKLGSLAGIVGFAKEAVEESDEFDGEMLIFSGMDSAAVDRFLAEYRKDGVEPVSLKAVITPHNIFWTAEKVYRELEREHGSLH